MPFKYISKVTLVPKWFPTPLSAFERNTAWSLTGSGIYLGCGLVGGGFATGSRLQGLKGSWDSWSF